ncbi:MAG: hypothetical protein RI897_2967 [Verrucomicrobiota bacterium]
MGEEGAGEVAGEGHEPDACGHAMGGDVGGGEGHAVRVVFLAGFREELDGAGGGEGGVALEAAWGFTLPEVIDLHHG